MGGKGIAPIAAPPERASADYVASLVLRILYGEMATLEIALAAVRLMQHRGFLSESADHGIGLPGAPRALLAFPQDTETPLRDAEYLWQKSLTPEAAAVVERVFWWPPRQGGGGTPPAVPLGAPVPRLTEVNLSEAERRILDEFAQAMRRQKDKERERAFAAKRERLDRLRWNRAQLVKDISGGLDSDAAILVDAVISAAERAAETVTDRGESRAIPPPPKLMEHGGSPERAPDVMRAYGIQERWARECISEARRRVGKGKVTWSLMNGIRSMHEDRKAASRWGNRKSYSAKNR